MPVLEKIFRLRQGANRFDPGISFMGRDDLDLEVKTLENIHPRHGFLETPSGVADLQTLNDKLDVNGFPSYTDPNGSTTNIYAVTTTNIYQFLPATQLFHTVSLLSLDDTTDIPISHAPWDTKVYFTKLGQPLIGVAGGTATKEEPNLVNAQNLSARYLINAENHLMFGNIKEGAGPTHFPRKLQWSDLDVPLTYTVSSSSEGGFHNFEPGDQEITGLARGKGFTYVFMRESIYACEYVKLPRIFEFIPIIRNLGNVYHYAVVEAAGMVFFIGPDNFYQLDGTQLTPIGDAIWKYFQDTQDIAGVTINIQAGQNSAKGEVFWLYQKDSSPWILIFNYQNRKWSWRDPSSAKSFQFFPVKPEGAETWGEQTYAWSHASADRAWNGAWNTSLFPFDSFIGLPLGLVRYETTARGIAGGSGLVGELETFEFHLGTLFDVKEIMQVKPLYKQTGTVKFKLKIGYRSTPSEAVAWSSELLSTNMLSGDAVFETRQTNLKELIRLKFNWTNNDTNYVEEIYGVSIKVNRRGES